MVVCPKHNRRLINSEVTAKSEQTFTFCCVEEYVTEYEPIMECNSLKIDYCRYLYDVFNSGIDMEKDIPISAIF